MGPRREMITPWSTTAVEIAQNMNISGLKRIEEYFPAKGEDATYDKMLQRLYHGLDQDVFKVDHTPTPSSTSPTSRSTTAGRDWRCRLKR